MADAIYLVLEMDSKILDAIGIGNLDPAIVIFVLLLICIGLFIFSLVLGSKLKKITENYENFMRGKNAETLEDTIKEKFSEIDNLVRNGNILKKDIQLINENLQITYQKVGIVKYDAFSEMGGKLSFALAMLNKDNTGYLINAMHSREGCYTYLKEIINGESYIVLGEEEKKALDKAVNFDKVVVEEE